MCLACRLWKWWNTLFLDSVVLIMLIMSFQLKDVMLWQYDRLSLVRRSTSPNVGLSVLILIHFQYQFPIKCCCWKFIHIWQFMNKSTCSSAVDRLSLALRASGPIIDLFVLTFMLIPNMDIKHKNSEILTLPPQKTHK